MPNTKQFIQGIITAGKRVSNTRSQRSRSNFTPKRDILTKLNTRLVSGEDWETAFHKTVKVSHVLSAQYLPPVALKEKVLPKKFAGIETRRGVLATEKKFYFNDHATTSFHTHDVNCALINTGKDTLLNIEFDVITYNNEKDEYKIRIKDIQELKPGNHAIDNVDPRKQKRSGHIIINPHYVKASSVHFYNYGTKTHSAGANELVFEDTKETIDFKESLIRAYNNDNQLKVGLEFTLKGKFVVEKHNDKQADHAHDAKQGRSI